MNALQEWLAAPWVEPLGRTLLHFLWQGAVLGTLAWVALRMTHKCSANVRYLMAALLMLALPALPVVTFLVLANAPTVAMPTPMVTVISGRSENEPAATGPTAARVALPVQTLSAPKLGTVMPPTLRLDQTVKLAAWWMVPFWLAGVLGMALRLGFGWLRIQGWQRSATTAFDVALLASFQRLTKKFGLGSRVRLLISKTIPGPVTYGWLRPAVLLPAQMLTGLPPELLEALLAHELAHIARRDYLANLVQSAIEVVLFYHPAVWWLGARLREIREECCDELAVQACGDRLTYARALESLAELQLAAEPAAAASGGNLLARISRIVGRAPETAGSSARHAAGIFILAGFAMGLFLLMPQVHLQAQANSTTMPAQNLTNSTLPLNTASVLTPGGLTFAGKSWIGLPLITVSNDTLAKADYLTNAVNVPMAGVKTSTGAVIMFGNDFDFGATSSDKPHAPTQNSPASGSNGTLKFGAVPATPAAVQWSGNFTGLGTGTGALAQIHRVQIAVPPPTETDALFGIGNASTDWGQTDNFPPIHPPSPQDMLHPNGRILKILRTNSSNSNTASPQPTDSSSPPGTQASSNLPASVSNGTLIPNVIPTQTNTQQWNGNLTFAGTHTLNLGTGAVTITSGGNPGPISTSQSNPLAILKTDALTGRPITASDASWSTFVINAFSPTSSPQPASADTMIDVNVSTTRANGLNQTHSGTLSLSGRNVNVTQAKPPQPDPTIRENMTIQVPTQLKVQRGELGLVVTADKESSSPIQISVGKNMLLVVFTARRVLNNGTVDQENFQSHWTKLNLSPNFSVAQFCNLIKWVTPETVSGRTESQPLVVEFEYCLAESPHGPPFPYGEIDKILQRNQELRVLWRKTLSVSVDDKSVGPEITYGLGPQAVTRPAQKQMAPPAPQTADGKKELPHSTVLAPAGEYESTLPNGKKVPVTLGKPSMNATQQPTASNTPKTKNADDESSPVPVKHLGDSIPIIKTDALTGENVVGASGPLATPLLWNYGKDERAKPDVDVSSLKIYNTSHLLWNNGNSFTGITMVNPPFPDKLAAPPDVSSGVSVVGEIKHRQPFILPISHDAPLKLSQAVLQAGWTEYSDHTVMLLRADKDHPGGTSKLINVDEILIKGNTSLDVELKPGDRVVVTRSWGSSN